MVLKTCLVYGLTCWPTLTDGANTSRQTSEHFSAVADASAQNTKIRQYREGEKRLFTEQKQHVSMAFSFTTEVCVVDCGPHGSCITGVCQCEEGWTGPECEQRDCHPRCIDHGVCREGKCDCHQGWTGEHCTIGEPRRHARHCTPTHTWQKGTNYRGNAFMDGLKRATLECECQYFQSSFKQIMTHFCRCLPTPEKHLCMTHRC